MTTRQLVDTCLHCDENAAAIDWTLCNSCAFRIYETIGKELLTWDRKQSKRMTVRRILNTNGYFSN